MFTDRYFKVPRTAKTALSFNPAAPGWNFLYGFDDIPLKKVDEFLDDYEADNYWQDHMQQYYGMVKCIDDNIGKLMSSIKGEGIDEDTIVVFTSDHGDMLFEHARFNKGQPYESSAGVPFLIRYPGTIPAGKIVETAYSSVDFAPTILSLMGLTHRANDFQGVDGSEELLNAELVSSNEEKIIISFDSGTNPTWAMSQFSHYKLVVAKGSPPWLFDLKIDPDELFNYIDSSRRQEIKKKLQDAILEALVKYKIPLLTNAEVIYIDKPACIDKQDILPITNGILARCEDIGGKVNGQKCERQEKVSDHCPVTCKSCCQDTNGIAIVNGQVHRSCSTMKDMCNLSKVKRFCPVTCQTCKP